MHISHERIELHDKKSTSFAVIKNHAHTIGKQSLQRPCSHLIRIKEQFDMGKGS
jgi:hypothetical protein